MGIVAKATIRVTTTAQSLPLSLDRLRKCSMATSAVSLMMECVMVAVLMYAQLGPCANTYAMEVWNATAWNRNTVLKLTNMDIQPATSRCVLKNTLLRLAAAPPGCALAWMRKARRCAYSRCSTGSPRMLSGTPTQPAPSSPDTPAPGAPAWPSSGGMIALKRSCSQKNSLTSSYMMRSTMGAVPRVDTSCCRNRYSGRTMWFR
mmetsp:Transcript_16971/g.41710  ORF Transcript_16971/g.41710 Transcript_16971/m.41710 type:complete len:204 (-) Transcript_16971:93-704(-)